LDPALEYRLRRAIEIDEARIAARRAKTQALVHGSAIKALSDALRIRFYRETQKIIDGAVHTVNAGLRPHGYRLLLVSSGGGDEEIVAQQVYCLGKPAPFGIELHLCLLAVGRLVGLIPTANASRPKKLGSETPIDEFDAAACEEILTSFVERALGADFPS
jgi:hypothetical protein